MNVAGLSPVNSEILDGKPTLIGLTWRKRKRAEEVPRRLGGRKSLKQVRGPNK